MLQWPLIALKDFEFKGKSYAKGHIFYFSVGDAYKLITRRQAKRATGLPSQRATAKAAAVEAPPVEPPPAIEPEPEPQPVVEEEAPEPESEPDEEEKPRRRRRRQSSYEADALPHESRESEWNSE